MLSIIKDVELFWAKVYTPVAPFGTPQYEVQLRTSDEDKKKELEAAGVVMKDCPEGGYQGNVKRKTLKANGDPLDPPAILDKNKNPTQVPIGNGSKGAVKLFSYDIKAGPRKGEKGAMLSALMITDLVEYAGGSDLDF